MTIDANRFPASAVSERSLWQTIAFFSLVFWLSGSLILDLVIMPTLYTTGMMVEPGFATGGYGLFWTFNRLELICSALVLTGVFVTRRSHDTFHQRGLAPVVLSGILLAIASICTYILTPQMGALGLHLNLFNSDTTMCSGLALLHGGYWGLEAIKFLLGGLLLNLFYHDRV